MSSEATPTPLTFTVQTAPAWAWKYSCLNPCSVQRPLVVPTHAQDLQAAIHTTQRDLLTERVAAEYHAAMQQMLASRLVRLHTELSKEVQLQSLLREEPVFARPAPYKPARFPSEQRLTP